MLGNVNRASLDFTSPGFIALMNSTGLSANRLASLNSAQLSLLVLQNLPRMLGSNIMQKPGMLGPMMETYGLTNFLGVEDAARYMRAKPEERAQIIQAAQANIKNQDLTAQAQLAWTNFSTQMQRASGVLEKVFAESLKNLAGLLAQLSHAIVDAVANLLRSDAIKRWIKLAADGLESLAKYVKTPQFEKDVSDWVKGISDFIRSLSDMMGGFEGIEHALTALDELLNRLAYYGTTAPSLAEQWKSYTENMPEAHGGGPGGVGVVVSRHPALCQDIFKNIFFVRCQTCRGPFDKYVGKIKILDDSLRINLQPYQSQPKTTTFSCILIFPACSFSPAGRSATFIWSVTITCSLSRRTGSPPSTMCWPPASRKRAACSPSSRCSGLTS